MHLGTWALGHLNGAWNTQIFESCWSTWAIEALKVLEGTLFKKLQLDVTSCLTSG